MYKKYIYRFIIIILLFLISVSIFSILYDYFSGKNYSFNEYLNSIDDKLSAVISFSPELNFKKNFNFKNTVNYIIDKLMDKFEIPEKFQITPEYIIDENENLLKIIFELKEPDHSTLDIDFLDENSIKIKFFYDIMEEKGFVKKRRKFSINRSFNLPVSINVSNVNIIKTNDKITFSAKIINSD
ncbi:MAG: hypothetical protein ACQESP_09945 [Candidatus Muiribacteriota bacterium]